MWSYVSVMVNSLSEVTVPLPAVHTRANPIQTQITQLKLAQYVKSYKKLDIDIKKLHSLIDGKCSKHLPSRLKEMPTFSQTHNSCNALTPLKEIKELAFNFNDYVDYKLSLAKGTITFNRFFHGKDMSNLQYQKTFDYLVDVIKQNGNSVSVHWGEPEGW
jgi:hypothetical protein